MFGLEFGAGKRRAFRDLRRDTEVFGGVAMPESGRVGLGRGFRLHCGYSLPEARDERSRRQGIVQLDSRV